MKQRAVLTMVLTCLVVAASLTAAGAQWLFLGIDDCSGDDTACSVGATPDPSLCNETTNGTTAVCWDGVTHSNGIGCGSSAWCTYKAVSAPSCTGGASPGFVYECIGPLPTITATLTHTATPTQTPTGTSTATPTSTPTPTLAAGCPATPVTCLAAGKNGLLIKTDTDSSKNQLAWKWKKGTAQSAQADFGDPVNGAAAYMLCLYDSTGGTPALVMGLNVAPGGTCGTDPCWKAISDKGWSYKNPTGSSEGVTKVKFKGGAAGKPSLQLRGKGAALPLPAPISPTQSLAEDPSVVVQFHSGSPATCWSSTFTATGTKKNDGAHFKATDP